MCTPQPHDCSVSASMLRQVFRLPACGSRAATLHPGSSSASACRAEQVLLAWPRDQTTWSWAASLALHAALHRRACMLHLRSLGHSTADQLLLLCRAARFCYGAAHGGQVMVPLSIARDLVSLWTGQELELQVCPTGVLAAHLGLCGGRANPSGVPPAGGPRRSLQRSHVSDVDSQPGRALSACRTCARSCARRIDRPCRRPQPVSQGCRPSPASWTPTPPLGVQEGPGSGPSRTLSASSRADSTTSAPPLGGVQRVSPASYLSAPAAHSLEAISDGPPAVRQGLSSSGFMAQLHAHAPCTCGYACARLPSQPARAVGTPTQAAAGWAGLAGQAVQPQLCSC